MNLSSDKYVHVYAPTNTYISNDLIIGGSFSSLNISIKPQIYFTPNRSVNTNGTSGSVYDIVQTILMRPLTSDIFKTYYSRNSFGIKFSCRNGLKYFRCLF